MFVSILLLGAFFVYLGWVHRIEQNNNPVGCKTITSKHLATSLFVIIGSGEYGLATLVLAFGFAGISFLLGLGGSNDSYCYNVRKNQSNI